MNFLQEAFHQFWHCIVIAGILFSLIAIGGVGALIMKGINKSLEDFTLHHNDSTSLLDKLDLWLFFFSKRCVNFYIKSAQWFGAIALFFLVLGGVGRFLTFTIMNWREIWGP